jgi:hypothetical protein
VSSDASYAVLNVLFTIVGCLLILLVPVITIKKHAKFYYIVMITIGCIILMFLLSHTVALYGILAVISGHRLRKVSSKHSFKEVNTHE